MQTDSYGYLSSGVKLWLLHHGNAPAHVSLLIHNILARLGPLRIFPVSKTEETHERTEICYEEIFRRKSSRLYQKVFIINASRIGKIAGTSVLHLTGISLKAII